MKDIMWDIGRTETGRGGLALMQKSIQNGYMFVDPEWDKFKESILNALTRPRPVTYFYETLCGQPDNLFSRSAYREALLELEEEGSILVFDSKGKTKNAATRPKRNRKPTLGEAYTIKRKVD